MNIRVHYEKLTAQITLSTPHKGNAFDHQMILDLTHAISQASQHPDIRVIVLSGEGKHFCSGGDLQWMKESVKLSAQENASQSQDLFDLFESLSQSPKVTIALAKGSSYGGGVGLLACCDFVYAKEDSRFCLSEAKVGLMPATIAPFVAQKIGWHKTKQLGIRANVIDVQQARQYGLVDGIAQEESDLIDLTNQCIEEVKKCSPESIKKYKELVREAMHMDASQLRLRTSEMIAQIRISPMGQEGLQAFIEKRKPSWDSHE
ncbi:MAG: enoyl-CoA hydratase/isomerase family protein [Bdellovibrionales bacterium]|nr:enoyl-CoA hydratase/isomerase family protein [Bdellovibrionales bacterium]